MIYNSFLLKLIPGVNESECRIQDHKGNTHVQWLLNNDTVYVIKCPGGTIIEVEHYPLALCHWKIRVRKVGSELRSVNEYVDDFNDGKLLSSVTLFMPNEALSSISLTESQVDDIEVDEDDTTDVIDQDAIGVDFLLSAILTKSLAFISDHPNAEVTVKLTNCGSHPDCTMRLSSSRLRAVEVHEDPEAA